MSLSLALAADLMVAVLLIVTIATTVRLSRRMAKMKADESAMRATIGELVVATDAAERAVAGLRRTLAEGEKALADRMRDAEQFSAELGRQVEDGAAVIARVSRLREAARTGPTPPGRVDSEVLGETARALASAAREVAERAARRVAGRAA